MNKGTYAKIVIRYSRCSLFVLIISSYFGYFQDWVIEYFRYFLLDYFPYKYAE